MSIRGVEKSRGGVGRGRVLSGLRTYGFFNIESVLSLKDFWDIQGEVFGPTQRLGYSNQFRLAAVDTYLRNRLLGICPRFVALPLEGVFSDSVLMAQQS